MRENKKECQFNDMLNINPKTFTIYKTIADEIPVNKNNRVCVSGCEKKIELSIIE